MSEFMQQRTIDAPELYRNMGFWNEATQQAILDTHVAIGGQGGAGYMYGLELARIGVQNFTIADPEEFEPVNGNRVLGVNSDTVGRNKAEVFHDEILKANEGAEVRMFTEGVNADNVEDFIGGAHLVLNATELSMPELGTMIAREARRREVPVLDVEYVGHGAQVTAFDPHSKMTFERFMGIEGGEDAPLDEVAEQTIDTSRFLAYIPPYADLSVLAAVQEGSALPSNVIGAGQAAQLGVAETLKHIRVRAGEKGLNPTFAPEVRWYDPYTGKSGSTRHSRMSYYRHVARAAFNNKRNRYEQASYSTEERAARGDID